ncbi:MAG: hypothetical protein GC162_21090 [Planctomycetes bacterium]|nr:hypothetical protein [Planctomycetota bacterium]
MSTPWHVILHDGGPASLVALASHAEHPRLLAVYIHDGRANDARAHACFTQQCEHYNIARKLELTLGHLSASNDPNSIEPGVGPRVPLADMQELLAACGLALQLHAERLLWPIQAQVDFDWIARVTETVQLVQQMVRIERDADLVIETPLLEMTDKQLVEIGHQMDVPWQMARSCEGKAATPCGHCAGCNKRHAAFTEAAIEDPLQLASA